MSDSEKSPSPVLDAINPRRIFFTIVVVLASGTVFYHHFEKLKWLDSVYFCVVTLTTVGYGDITPKTDIGKLFTIFYILIGVGIIASSVSYLLRNRVQKRLSKKNPKS